MSVLKKVPGKARRDQERFKCNGFHCTDLSAIRCELVKIRELIINAIIRGPKWLTVFVICRIPDTVAELPDAIMTQGKRSKPDASPMRQ